METMQGDYTGEQVDDLPEILLGKSLPHYRSGQLLKSTNVALGYCEVRLHFRTKERTPYISDKSISERMATKLVEKYADTGLVLALRP